MNPRRFIALNSEH